MRRLLSVALVLVTSTVLAAQGSGRQEEVLRQRIDERIQQMRKAIRDGKPIVSNVRVKVRLRNQNKVTGVVKNGRFVERVDGLEFVKADTQTPGAGIRVWYYNNTNSYMFLPFDAIASYQIGQRLTEVDIQKIEEQIRDKQQAAEDRRLARLRALRSEVGAGTEGEGEDGENGGGDEADPATRTNGGSRTAAAGAGSGTSESKAGAEEQRLMALLAEFPPDQGWGVEKLADIERAKVVIGAFPDERSQRFIDVFDDWQRAYQMQLDQQGPRPPMPAGGVSTSGNSTGVGPAPTPGPSPAGGPSGATPPRPRY